MQLNVAKKSSGFFYIMQKLYAWLSASTHRWHIHTKHLDGLSVEKPLSDTRWSARHDAVKALNKGYEKTVAALEELSSDATQPKDSQCVSQGFIKNMKKLETAILLELWDVLLER